MPEVTGRLRSPRLASAPSSPVVGELYYDTAANVLYWWNGTSWVAASGAAAVGGDTAMRSTNVGATSATTVGSWLMLGMPTTWEQKGAASTRFTVASDSVTVNKDGVYAISAAVGYGTTVSGPRRITRVILGSNPDLNILVQDERNAAGNYPSVSLAWTGWLASGSVIRVPSYIDASAIGRSIQSFVIAEVAGPAGASGANRVTSLPGSPTDGLEVVYVADNTNGVLWRLRYNAASASAYKWEFVGGPPLYNQKAGDSSTASTTYADLADGAGPQLTAPLAGDYMIEWGAGRIYLGTSAGSTYMSVQVGATAAVDGDAAFAQLAANSSAPAHQSLRRTIAAASTAVTAKYRSTSGSCWAISRWMKLTPVRVA